MLQLLNIIYESQIDKKFPSLFQQASIQSSELLVSNILQKKTQNKKHLRLYTQKQKQRFRHRTPVIVLKR